MVSGVDWNIESLEELFEAQDTEQGKYDCTVVSASTSNMEIGYCRREGALLEQIVEEKRRQPPHIKVDRTSQAASN